MKPQLITSLIVLEVALLFTAFGFFIEQPCDIDAVYLWCRLHPFSIADLIGCILFYGGCAFLAGLPFLRNLELFNPESSSRWNIILGVAMVLGVVLIWNL